MTDQNNPPFFGEPVTDSEVAAIKLLKSAFANRCYVTTEVRNIRIHFAELVGGEPLYHTAITLSAADAYTFGELIMKVAAAGLSPAGTAEGSVVGPESPSGE